MLTSRRWHLFLLAAASAPVSQCSCNRRHFLPSSLRYKSIAGRLRCPSSSARNWYPGSWDLCSPTRPRFHDPYTQSNLRRHSPPSSSHVLLPVLSARSCPDNWFANSCQATIGSMPLPARGNSLPGGRADRQQNARARRIQAHRHR